MVTLLERNSTTNPQEQNGKQLNQSSLRVAAVHARTAELPEILAQISELTFHAAKLLNDRKQNLKPKEYRTLLHNELGWVPAHATPFIKVAQAFCFSDIDKEKFGNFNQAQLIKLAKNPQVLQELLEHENDIRPSLADDIARARRSPRKPRKAQAETGWQHSGAGRIYQVALPDATGVIIEKLAEQKEVIPQRIIEQAVGVLATLQGNLNQKDGQEIPIPPSTMPFAAPSGQILLLEKVLEAKNEELEELQKRLRGCL